MFRKSAKDGFNKVARCEANLTRCDSAMCQLNGFDVLACPSCLSGIYYEVNNDDGSVLFLLWGVKNEVLLLGS